MNLNPSPFATWIPCPSAACTASFPHPAAWWALHLAELGYAGLVVLVFGAILGVAGVLTWQAHHPQQEEEAVP